jgi:tetratricopeptide (TPR) repeat protein
MRADGGKESENLRLAEHSLKIGRLDDAERACREILSINSRSTEALVLLGRISEKGGRSELAVQLLRKALKIDPANREALDCLENLLYSGGRHLEAAEIWKSQIAHNPDDFAAHRNLGMCYLAMGNLRQAATCFTKALELEPDSAPLYQRLGVAYQGLGDMAAAAEAFRKAITLEPREPSLHIALAQTLVQLNDSEGAVYAFQRASELEPESARGNLQLAQAFLEGGRLDDAENQLRKVIAMDPNLVSAHVFLGGLLNQVGRFDEAVDALTEAIRLDPRHVPAYYFYIQSKKIVDEDRPLIERLAALERDPEQNPDSQRRLHYGLGKAYDDLGEYGAAIRHFDAANAFDRERLRADGRSFSSQRYVDAFNFAIKHYTPEFFEDSEIWGSLDEMPLLIVGMMRSGTTLVEQIVSSHPQIGAGGESTFWTQRGPLLNSLGAHPKREEFAEIANAYHETLRELAPGRKRVTDKMPHNYMFLGPIHMIFPKARIIHCRRNPIDTCLSIYTTPMRESPDFAHVRENIVFAYRQYLRLMEHWRAVLPPDRFLEVDYEAIVANQEEETRRMINFVGLEWDDACLRHEENDRAIRTPSMWQARQPVYKSSVARWERYKPWLGAFAELSETTTS